jgi:uncharacterized membrane-anchored protein YhcB (DUF1043 family)
MDSEEIMSQYIEILVTLGFLGALMWGMMKFLLRDIQKDLSDLKSDIKEFRTELKSDHHRSEARIDHLYEENNRLYHLILEKLNQK